MKISALLIALSILGAAGIVSFVAQTYLSNLANLQEKQARDKAVDGCMQNARYSWQAQNQQNSQFINNTQEPDRYWYRLCMQEKGYDIVIDI